MSTELSNHSPLGTSSPIPLALTLAIQSPHRLLTLEYPLKAEDEFRHADLCMLLPDFDVPARAFTAARGAIHAAYPTKETGDSCAFQIEL
jgi:hypothetical protein